MFDARMVAVLLTAVESAANDTVDPPPDGDNTKSVAAAVRTWWGVDQGHMYLGEAVNPWRRCQHSTFNGLSGEI